MTKQEAFLLNHLPYFPDWSSEYILVFKLGYEQKYGMQRGLENFRKDISQLSLNYTILKTTKNIEPTTIKELKEYNLILPEKMNYYSFVNN